MDISQLLLSFSLLLLVALILLPIARKLVFPYPTLLVIAGYLGSEWLISRGIDTGLRWDSFRDLVYYLLLPILIFEAAFSLNAEKLFKNLFSILVLGVPLMLLGALITAVILFFGIGHPTGFPVVAALITGILLSATGPSAIISILEQLNAPERLTSILEGEGLFNNVVAIILVSLIIQFVVLDGDKLTVMGGFILFVRMFIGGLLVGMAVGAIGWLLIRWDELPILRGVISLITMYSGYLLAEGFFHVSGLVSVLVTGLLLNAFTQKAEQQEKQFLVALWEYKAYIANVTLFILLGVSIRFSLLADQWLAIVIGILAVLIARAVMVFIGLWLLGSGSASGSGSGKEVLSLHDKGVIYWGNIKGAVAIALVLSLPDTMPYGTTIQGITYGVVLFSLFVQAPTLRFLLNRSRNAL